MQKIAVVVPCYNEEGAIGAVIRDVARVLPDAHIHVCDNNSTDRTAAEARAAGAVVIAERSQGKGHAVRRLFSEIDADVYLMLDGDGTYDIESAPRLIALLVAERLDMVIGKRMPAHAQNTYRPGHVFGNRLLTVLARFFFGRGFTDMLSGYRVFSRRFVKSLPVLSAGFEIETEMTLHCLSLNLPHAEVETPYYERAHGTESKLRTYRDGMRIVLLMIRLFKDYRPLAFFNGVGAFMAALALILFAPVLSDYLETGLVARLPTAILSTGLMVAAFLSVNAGFILDSVARHRLENKKLAYLAQPPWASPFEP
ncbi:MAG: glycosyl transferase family protein [Rhodospirillaceae bacterium]|nr:MAG: glycosyl transferase family protein [Rhodospirillaceae bacterium]